MLEIHCRVWGLLGHRFLAPLVLVDIRVPKLANLGRAWPGLAMAWSGLAMVWPGLGMACPALVWCGLAGHPFGP